MDVIGLISDIYKSAGKEDLYLKIRPAELEELVEIAKVQSTESSNAIEGIVTTSTRVRHLVEEKTTPKDRSEMEIAGYRDALNLIHKDFDAIPITPSSILSLHKTLYTYMSNPEAGKFKSTQNYINANFCDGGMTTVFTPLPPNEVEYALGSICREYNKVISEGVLSPLIAIPVFIHDFLCIHPFNDGNGRISRLLTTLLLYKNGFRVGKYISIEAKIANTKDLYYDALAEAQEGWHAGCENPVAFIKYLLGTIISAYRDLEERFSLVEDNPSAYEAVKRASKSCLGRFTKQDIRALCPSFSISSIEGALRRLVLEEEISREGKGKSTVYFNLK